MKDGEGREDENKEMMRERDASERLLNGIDSFALVSSRRTHTFTHTYVERTVSAARL